MKCPIHDTELFGKPTRYGMRYACSEPGCTVVGWDGPTSTPADAETREIRHRAHSVFDPLWKGQHPVMRRGEAYRWLSAVMEVPQKKAHIGMFNAAQCRCLIDAARERTGENK